MKKILLESLLAIALLAVFWVIGIPRFASYLHNQGAGLYEKERYEEAISYFKRSLRLNPKSVITHFNLANAYMELKEDREAIEEYKRAIELNPGHAGSYRALSRIYADRALFEEAIALLKNMQSIPPNSVDSEALLKAITFEFAADCLEKGTDLFLKGSKQEAYRLMYKSIELQPKFVYAYYSVAVCHFSEGDYPLAENALKTAVAIDPEFWLAYKLLGDLYFQKGMFKDAADHYKKAAALNDKDAGLFHDLGLALMNLERYDEALPYLKQAIACAPQDQNIRYSYASVYRDSGRLNEAAQEYTKLISIQPDYPNVHNDLGDIYRNQGKEKEALQEYQKEIGYCRSKLSNKGDDIVTLNNYAYALMSIGEYDKSMDIVNKIIALHPNFRQPYLTLAKIYEKIGRTEQATEALNKARSLSTETNFMDREISRLKRDFSDIKSKIRPENIRK